MISNGNKILVDIKKNILLSTEDQVIYAEPLQVLDCVQSNYSITNANTNNEKFKQIFPDSPNVNFNKMNTILRNIQNILNNRF